MNNAWIKSRTGRGAEMRTPGGQTLRVLSSTASQTLSTVSAWHLVHAQQILVGRMNGQPCFIRRAFTEQVLTGGQTLHQALGSRHNKQMDVVSALRMVGGVLRHRSASCTHSTQTERRALSFLAGKAERNPALPGCP